MSVVAMSCVFVPLYSERGDTSRGATVAALGLGGDHGLGLEAVLSLVVQLLQSQFVGAAVHLIHLLQSRGDRRHTSSVTHTHTHTFCVGRRCTVDTLKVSFSGHILQCGFP